MNACPVEHRWGERTPVKLIGSERTLHGGRLKCLSISGALIETRLSGPILSDVTLIVLGARHSLQHPRALRGYVVRQCRGAICLGWWHLSPSPVEDLLAVAAARKVLAMAGGPHRWGVPDSCPE